jgi:type I restriction enzyme R subunit
MAEELEWKTRKERIDKKLKSLNPPWSIIKYHDGLDISTLQCHAVEECPTANGPADYTLFAKGKLLGIIEAKKVKVSPQNVLEQAIPDLTPVISYICLCLNYSKDDH